jgi:hypothetical protein
MRPKLLPLALVALAAPASAVPSPQLDRPRPEQPQPDRPQPDRPQREQGPLEVHAPPATAGVAWFGTWEGALAEARRTARPILFMSAAPQCQGVPGVW